ncbi:DUF1993 domain-containing protein [Hydrogenophaga sp.]|jgi:hypothetical protein|uniref:DUF1993 domain-containing protein n=1 Tax=Hydrogenophaga sp. TaxID=1904254 RepID=UPI00286DF374|nr:DUF1993 domain-containing protein [Hydrogenophaga sp.]
MSFSMYAASAEVYVRMLRNLLTWLDKAEGHAKARGFDSGVFLGTKLAPDMLSFGKQVAIASEVARLAVARLGAIDLPAAQGSDESFDGLRVRVRDAIAFVEGVSPEQLAGSAERAVVLPQRHGDPLHFTGQTFLQQWSLPNFFFHVTTAYALLRQAGVELGKADYLGPMT